MFIRTLCIILIFIVSGPILAQVQDPKAPATKSARDKHPEHDAVMKVVNLFFEAVDSIHNSG